MAGNPHYAGLFNLGDEHGQTDKVRWSGDNGIYTYPLTGGLTMSAKLKDLPVEERIRVVEDLWDSIAADQKTLPLTAEQKTELDHRSEESSERHYSCGFRRVD